MTPNDRDLLDADIRTHLARLDGTTASAVALLSGIPARELDQLGGIAEEGRMRRRYRWLHHAHHTACRIGLHFPTWNHQCDAYTCACRRILLGSEDIRP